MDLDEDALIACADLIGRTGATGFEIGYLHDGVPAGQAGWYAHAQFKGARITAEDHKGPIEAAEALARRILTGAKCQHCGGLVAFSDDGAIFYEGRLADGSRFTLEEARNAPQCRWTRMGRRWERGCQRTPDAEPSAAPAGNRRQRRSAAAKQRKKGRRR